MEQEQNQAGAIGGESQELNPPGITSVDPSIEKEPTPKTYSQEAYSRAQSERDSERYRADSAEAKIAALTETIAELEQEQERLAEGDPDGLAAIKARREARAAKQELRQLRHENEQYKKAQETIQAENESRKNKEYWAGVIAKEHGVNIAVLQPATNLEEMIQLAIKAKGTQQQATSQAPHFDTGLSDASGGTSFSKIEQAYINGDVSYSVYAKALKEQQGR